MSPVMSPVTVFFAAAQAGEAICGAVEYLAPVAAAALALHGIRRVTRWAHGWPARHAQRRFYRQPHPDLDETEASIDDLVTCRRIHRAHAIPDHHRNTGTLQPRRRKEQP